MLDGTSLEIISRFKQAVLTKKLPGNAVDLSNSNRGNKLLLPTATVESLHSKVVEYDGVNHLVLTNETIEKSNLRNKRKWNDYYGTPNDEIELGIVDDDDDEDEYNESDNDNEDDDDDDEHPFKKIKIAEILAPLNHPSEIISHPAISKTYKSPVFNKLAGDLIELIEVEQENLNYLNKLLQVLNGEDWFYLLEENIGLQEYDHGLDEDRQKSKPATTAEANDNNDNKNTEEKETDDIAPVTEKSKSEEKTNGRTRNGKEVKSESEEVTDPFFALPEALKRYEAHQVQFESDDELTTLKDELINYLQVSIQRQHEYIKNLSLLRNGIVRADRLKKDLHKWGKEMYDKKSS
ncbi:RXT2-like protein [Scheffersomyces xylosifermentans]|uniref:RXT2-like protein n=1 Tax=Scheffersomyces xylosifermentans TaxID=1304137 RepID=UPI00315DBF70